MRRSSGRGAVEPFAALAAVFAISVGLVVYAGAVETALPGSEDRERKTAKIALDRAYGTLQRTGVIDPERLSRVARAVPDRLHANATLRTGQRRWSVGPAPGGRGRSAERPVSVRIAPGRVRAGTLRVVVWS